MNYWTPTTNGWGDQLDSSSMPWYALYDYVEVYKYDDLVKEFKFEWKDDFTATTLDLNRWTMTDGRGFEDNSSIFMKSQVYLQNGNLVMKM